MPIMLSKTHAAFVAAGAPDEQARAAAEEIADFEHRLTGIETRLANIEADIRLLQGDIRLVKWTLGVVLACVVVPLVKSLVG